MVVIKSKQVESFEKKEEEEEQEAFTWFSIKKSYPHTFKNNNFITILETWQLWEICLGY